MVDLSSLPWKQYTYRDLIDLLHRGPDDGEENDQDFKRERIETVLELLLEKLMGDDEKDEDLKR
jgi:hypothetical protein